MGRRRGMLIKTRMGRVISEHVISSILLNHRVNDSMRKYREISRRAAAILMLKLIAREQHKIY